MTAPVDGRVFFPSILQENQFVTLGQELLYIAPPGRDYFGELRVPQQKVGKVEVGQQVLIKFEGFPYEEFWVLQGRITYIADVLQKDSVLLAKVELPQGLKTTYNKSLVVKTGMTASADILTDDSRLLEKLFYQLRKISSGR